MNSDCRPEIQAGHSSRGRNWRAGGTPGVGKLFCAAGLAAALSGCAISFVDRNGDTHYQGLLVHVVVRKADDKREVRAESVRVKSFGLTLLSGLQRTNITLGYNDDTMTLVRGDSCVVAGRHSREISLGPATIPIPLTGNDSDEKQ